MFAVFSTILAASLLAAIPPTHGAEFQVVVGGTGILQFNPNQVVSTFIHQGPQSTALSYFFYFILS